MDGEPELVEAMDFEGEPEEGQDYNPGHDGRNRDHPKIKVVLFIVARDLRVGPEHVLASNLYAVNRLEEDQDDRGVHQVETNAGRDDNPLEER